MQKIISNRQLTKFAKKGVTTTICKKKFQKNNLQNIIWNNNFQKCCPKGQYSNIAKGTTDQGLDCFKTSAFNKSSSFIIMIGHFRYLMEKVYFCSALSISPFTPKALTSLRLRGRPSPLSIWTMTYLPDIA